MAKTQRGRDHIDVLVVGAGPTGLTIAGELARRGVTTRIIERRADKSSLSKALVLQARTLEMMDLADLADEFLERGYPAPGLDIGLSTDEPVAVNLQHLDTRFPFLLVLPQVDTEQILERRLSQHGMTVERGVSFERLERNDAEGVAAIARHDDGGEEQIRSNYLVGCDGTHSLVRDALGLPFEGEDLADIVFLADVKLDAEFVRSRIANFTSERGFLSILPFLGTYSRVFAVDLRNRIGRPQTH